MAPLFSPAQLNDKNPYAPGNPVPAYRRVTQSLSRPNFGRLKDFFKLFRAAMDRDSLHPEVVNLLPQAFLPLRPRHMRPRSRFNSRRFRFEGFPSTDDSKYGIAFRSSATLARASRLASVSR